MRPLTIPTWMRGASPLVRRAKRTARRWLHRHTPRSLILMYHRVAHVPCDPWDQCVAPEHFAQQLEVLHRTAKVIPLEQLLNASRTGKTPAHAVALTLDDGYADNLLTARPLLEQHAFPATFFLATGALGQPKEFWWDELERLLLHPGTLPECLELAINGEPRKWFLGAENVYSAEAWEQHRHWRARQSPTTTRQRIFYEVWALLRPLPVLAQERIMDELASWSGAPRAPRATHRLLTIEEARILGNVPQFELGGHTINHVALSTQTPAVQEQEIQSGKSAIESIANQEARFFAYPYGDYSAQTATIVRNSGFASAVTTDAACVNRHADPWLLPRFAVFDCDGETFARRLSAMFEPK
jgi:peptidoglycan/xylan/chitin deacetylase (PgdA/CDA1 family)